MVAVDARNGICAVVDGRRRLIQYLKTKGLELLKKRLIANREKYRVIIKSRKKMLKDLENG